MSEVPAELKERIRKALVPNLAQVFAVAGKLDRAQRLREAYDTHLPNYADSDEALVRKAFEEITKETMRTALFATGKRIDGRGPDDIRQITCEAPVLPRTHGSALFTRGETQALAITTFGTSDDEQKIESVHEGESYRSFLLHYNFPPSAWARSSVSGLRRDARSATATSHTVPCP